MIPHPAGPSLGAPLTLRGAQAYRTDAEILTPEACCAACTADPKCRAWVLESTTSANPPTCRLKASAGAAFACPLCPFGASLGPPPAPPPPACPAQQPKPKPPSPPAPSQQPAAGSKPHVLMFLQDVCARPPRPFPFLPQRLTRRCGACRTLGTTTWRSTATA